MKPYNVVDPRRCTFTRMAKLTEKQVRAIRADKRLLREVAADYPVTLTTIGKIRRGEIWKWVK